MAASNAVALMTPMPGMVASRRVFACKLDDEQIADVATYVRNSWGNAAEPVHAGQIASLRKKLHLVPPLARP
jgi:mono/diheme cytochrome c family protein